MHTWLVSLMLHADGFDHYRCEHNISVGVNLNNMAKALNCAEDNDTAALTAHPLACLALKKLRRQARRHVSCASEGARARRSGPNAVPPAHRLAH